ncbi:hypothetical protein AB0L63_05405 [Nocardia sp. NPDC051990]|uniref:hypothetical protein n=1 Tax=Nocardia sp. NPDC051990 TaxID=3155285 RepID=UPI0034244589
MSRISWRRATVVIVIPMWGFGQRPIFVAAPIRGARSAVARSLLTVAMPQSSQVIALYNIAIVSKDSLTAQVGDLSPKVLE